MFKNVKNDVSHLDGLSLSPFIALIVCNLTNLIYRLFRKTSMNGVRLGFYIRIECLYIRPRKVSFAPWKGQNWIFCSKYRMPLRETSCTKMETKDMNSIKRKSILGERPHSKTARKKNYFTINCCCRIIRKNLQFFIPFYFISIYNLS